MSWKSDSCVELIFTCQQQQNQLIAASLSKYAAQVDNINSQAVNLSRMLGRPKAPLKEFNFKIKVKKRNSCSSELLIFSHSISLFLLFSFIFTCVLVWYILCRLIQVNECIWSRMWVCVCTRFWVFVCWCVFYLVFLLLVISNITLNLFWFLFFFSV